MDFQKEENRIYKTDENGKLIAEVRATCSYAVKWLENRG